MTQRDWQKDFEGAKESLIAAVDRADAAEIREQQLKEALELLVFMFRFDPEEGRAYMNFGDFEEVLEPDDNAAYIAATNILSTLYPDTPAPKEEKS